MAGGTHSTSGAIDAVNVCNALRSATEPISTAAKKSASEDSATQALRVGLHGLADLNCLPVRPASFSLRITKPVLHAEQAAIAVRA